MEARYASQIDGTEGLTSSHRRLVGGPGFTIVGKVFVRPHIRAIRSIGGASLAGTPPRANHVRAVSGFCARTPISIPRHDRLLLYRTFPSPCVSIRFVHRARRPLFLFGTPRAPAVEIFASEPMNGVRRKCAFQKRNTEPVLVFSSSYPSPRFSLFFLATRDCSPKSGDN